MLMNVIRRDRPASGILWSEFHLDGGDAGRFVLQLDTETLTKRASAATFAHAEQVRIAVGIHPAKGEVVIFFGEENGSERRYVYQLPYVPASDGRGPNLETSFAKGKIVEVS